MSVPEKLQKVENQNSAWIHRMKTRGWLCGAEQDWGVGGDLSTRAWGTENRERGWVVVVSYPPDHRPTMGWDAGAHTWMPPCPFGFMTHTGVTVTRAWCNRRAITISASRVQLYHPSHSRCYSAGCQSHIDKTAWICVQFQESFAILPSIQKVYEFLMGHYLASPVHCTNMPRVALNQQWISCMIRSYSEGFQLSPAQNTNPGGVSDSWYGFGARESRSPACHPGIWAIRALVYGSSYSSGTPWGFAQCYPWYVLSCMCSRHFLACALLGMMMRCPMWCSWFMLHCIILISANTFHTSVQPIARYVLLRVMWSPKQQQQQQQR